MSPLRRALLADWEGRAARERDATACAALRAVARVAGAVCARHGRLWGEPALLASVAVRLACNDHGSVAIGRLIEPAIAEAVRAEGYALLPAQREPVVMNIKGASASGKSTMRPLQKKLADEIGVAWGDFALISPDIWRKQLLDYGSLGEAVKYAGSFTGQELRMIDQKLDRYMAAKAERGGIPHLLIDRFRFDSFAPESDEAGSNLLTRFGRTIYLFFMITPPDATVERSWKRGLEVGRYKAVDDLLAHNVEAYAGMPELFFTWALALGKRVHYEFLDNSVPAGERPKSAAFGRDGELNVLDVKCMLDIARYARINVDADEPAGGLPRFGRDGGRGEHGLPCGLRAPPAGAQFRRARKRPRLPAHRGRPHGLGRAAGARRRARGSRDAGRDPGRGAAGARGAAAARRQRGHDRAPPHPRALAAARRARGAC